MSINNNLRQSIQYLAINFDKIKDIECKNERVVCGWSNILSIAIFSVFYWVNLNIDCFGSISECMILNSLLPIINQTLEGIYQAAN